MKCLWNQVTGWVNHWDISPRKQTSGIHIPSHQVTAAGKWDCIAAAGLFTLVLSLGHLFTIFSVLAGLQFFWYDLTQIPQLLGGRCTTSFPSGYGHWHGWELAQLALVVRPEIKMSQGARKRGPAGLKRLSACALLWLTKQVVKICIL